MSPRALLRALLRLVAPIAALGGAAQCPSEPEAGVTPTARSYRMGFSGFPPKLDQQAAVASVMMWSLRADAAIFHAEPPWALLLQGGDARAHIAREVVPLAQFYRSRHLPIFVTFDLTDGLGREREARELRAAGRSLAEPAVQRLFLAWMREWLAAVRPEYVGLGAEVNLIRLAAPPAVYDAVRVTASAAAAEVRTLLPSATLYTTLQVDAAWGRLQGSNAWIGVERELSDFPFAQALGLSSYPYLARFAAPEDMPIDYLARMRGPRTLPVFVAEGGWSSASLPGIAGVPAVSSSPEVQARYVRRMHEVLARAGALAWFQLNFADLDVTTFPVLPEAADVLSLFLRIGLVDSELRAKPALAAWDGLFALPRR